MMNTFAILNRLFTLAIRRYNKVNNTHVDRFYMLWSDGDGWDMLDNLICDTFKVNFSDEVPGFDEWLTYKENWALENQRY